MTVFAIVFLTVIAVILLTAMVFMMRGDIHFGYKTVSNDLVLDEIYQDRYSRIRIDADASNIEFKDTDDDQIRVIIYGDKELTSVSSSGSELSIATKAKKCFGFCFNTKIDKVTIYLPSTYAGSIEVIDKYGDIEVGAFESVTMTIREDCGDVQIEKVDTLDIENSYGDIEIGYVRKSKIKADCGDIKITSLKDGDIANSFGDIKIESVEGHIEIDESCGKVSVDRLILNEDSYIKNSFGDIIIGATNDIYMDASTSLGDVKIQNNYRNANVTLKLTNDCGDIKVDN